MPCQTTSVSSRPRIFGFWRERSIEHFHADWNRGGFRNGSPISRFPSFSDGTEHLGKDGLCCQPLGELVHQRAQPVFWHGRDELVEHVTLPEQRVGASFGCIRFEKSVVAERFS